MIDLVSEMDIMKMIVTASRNSVPNVINLHTAAAPLPIVADISHLRGGEPAGLLALLQDELVAVFGLLE